MCLRQILAAHASTGDKQTLDNRSIGENTIGIDINAPAVTASPSTENNEPSSIARTPGEDLISDSKGNSNFKRGSEIRDETSSGKSREDNAEKEREAKIRKRAKQIEEDYKRRLEAAKAKGNVYEVYNSNDMTDEDY